MDWTGKHERMTTTDRRRTFLETERLRLRAFTEADEDYLVALDADPEVMRFINGGRATPRETVRARVLPRVLRDFPFPVSLSGTDTGIRGYWAAEERAGGRFLGWFEFRPVGEDGPATVELGYRLSRAAWGRGYATEGSRALIDKGFTELGTARVTANTMAVNARSRRVMEKVGLRFVRTSFREWPEAIDGSEHGEVEYALTRAEWAERKPESRGEA